MKFINKHIDCYAYVKSIHINIIFINSNHYNFKDLINKMLNTD